MSHGAGTPISVEGPTGFADAAPLREVWDALVAREHLSPSHGFDWHQVLWEVHCARQGVDFLLARTSDGIAGIVPLRIQPRGHARFPARVLEPLISCYAVQGTQFIVSEPKRAVLREIVRHIEGSGARWDIWIMHYPRGEAQAVLLEEILRERKLPFTVVPAERSPYLPVEATWEEYLAKLDGRFRQNLRRIENRMRAKGDVTLRIIDSRGDWRGALDALYEVEAASWKQEAGTAITRIGHQARFYRDYAEHAAAASQLSLSLLYVGDEPVASGFALRRDGTYYMLKSSYKASWRSFSPGVLRRKLLFERLFRDGVRELEFLGEAEPDKLRWTERIREYVAYYIFNRRIRSRVFLLRHQARQWLDFRSRRPGRGAQPEAAESTPE